MDYRSQFGNFPAFLLNKFMNRLTGYPLFPRLVGKRNMGVADFIVEQFERLGVHADHERDHFEQVGTGIFAAPDRVRFRHRRRRGELLGVIDQGEIGFFEQRFRIAGCGVAAIAAMRAFAADIPVPAVLSIAIQQGIYFGTHNFSMLKRRWDDGTENARP